MDPELRGCQGSAVALSDNPGAKTLIYEMKSVFVPADSVFLSYFEKSSHPVFLKVSLKFLPSLFPILTFQSIFTHGIIFFYFKVEGSSIFSIWIMYLNITYRTCHLYSKELTCVGISSQILFSNHLSIFLLSGLGNIAFIVRNLNG